MPVSAGSALSSCVNASSPSAEAPTPTTGNDAPLPGSRLAHQLWTGRRLLQSVEECIIAG